MHARRSFVLVLTLCSLLTPVSLLAQAAPTMALRGPATILTEVAISPSRVDWLPLVDYERLVLTVAGPKDLNIRQEFGTGEPPSLGLTDSGGIPLPDGSYSYEIWITPRQKAGVGLPLRHSGYLAVSGGSFVTTEFPESMGPVSPSPLKRITDEQITSERACIGPMCSTGDEGFPLKLKDEFTQLILEGDVPNIYFKDDAAGGNSADHSWVLQANELFQSAEYLALWDVETLNKVLIIEGDAPQASLYMRSNGNIGMGTSTPAVRLDVKASAAGQATERLQNSSSTGYSGTEYLDNTGNVDLFFGVDNAASTTRLNSVNNNPITILTNSTERMRITSAGSFGIGTSSPAYKFHVSENLDANTVSTVETSNTGASAAAFLRTQSDAGVNQIGMHSSGRTLTRFGQTLGGRGEILHAGGNGLLIGTLEADDLILGTNNTNRLQISSTGTVTVSGNLTVNGTFSNPSSLALKEDFKPLDPKTVLDKFARLPIQEWSYKSDDRKLRHVGPTVEDFQASFGLGTEGQHIFPMDVQGVTMAAVQGLYQLAQEKDEQIAELQKELREIKQLLLEKGN